MDRKTLIDNPGAKPFLKKPLIVSLKKVKPISIIVLDSKRWSAMIGVLVVGCVRRWNYGNAL